MVAVLAGKIAPYYGAGKSKKIFVMLRAAEISPPTGLEQIKVLLVCGRLKLNLVDVVQPKQRRDSPVMVNVTVWIGSVKVVIQPGVESVDHKAFVMRLNRPLEYGMLAEAKTKQALVVVASMAFFGDVEIKESIGIQVGVPGA